MTQTTAAPRMNLVGRRSPYIFEDWNARIFRVNREVFRSDEIFARERRLWDRLWLYLGHETEVPKAGDFKIRTLAGRPLIFTRDSKGQVRAYLNACPHRGPRGVSAGARLRRDHGPARAAARRELPRLRLRVVRNGWTGLARAPRR